MDFIEESGSISWAGVNATGQHFEGYNPAMSSSLPHQIAGHGTLARVSRAVREGDMRTIDVLLALVLSIAALAVILGRPDDNADFRSDDVLGAVLALAQTVPLAFRRAAPLGVVIVISVALVVHSALGYEVMQAGTVSSLVAVYGVASLTDTRTSVIGAAITAAAIAGFYATNRGDWNAVDIAAVSATWAMAWLFGTFVRLRSEQAEAAGVRVASLEAEQEARAREAVADERARMARELHDIVGHALNLIVIQSGGAQRVLDTRPEVSREALASIEATGREALTEMERMLGVLRPASNGDAEAGPQAGLSQLDTLASHVSDAGIPVEVIVEGDRRDVPASVELSIYRIVQEALTNCLKHSGASRANVTLRYEPDAVEVEVVDNGHGIGEARSNDYRGGRGQIGMRERVALFGGEIEMGPVTAGGYRVWARLPAVGSSS
jgi:signal transduction histidine kinase